ncbi:uncharacterized protein loaf isoform X1 [Lepeophtheirus salmonis]|uniref:uncharacterized protein loaf isoform X1 n=1 Tax=Lepeophtheirus salmonis TaxID=72036 RepID=UPI001AE7C42A|nr:uncharacterized protein LOC121121749 isoform X1 [Lepeophtheirus salmonis]XP_040572663.1 uncharacterized protein LOC121121749 isoform X1 [Lepeophtheirus salmonis]
MRRKRGRRMINFGFQNGSIRLLGEDDQEEEEEEDGRFRRRKGRVRMALSPSPLGSFHLLFVFILLLSNIDPLKSGVSAIKNEFLPISTLCERSQKSFLSNIPRPIDGAVIESRNERDVDCVVTFQTESILERFMLRFEDLKIDCNDHLYIFDGAHAIGNHRAIISCDKTKDSVGHGGVIFTRTNFVTLKYVTDSWGMDLNGFKLVITAFKDGKKTGCREGFSCDDRLCINKDLVCDTVNHCGDGEDERSSQFCSLKRTGHLFSAIMSIGRICPCLETKDSLSAEPARQQKGLSFLPLFMDDTSMVAIALAIILLLLAGIVAVWISFCRKTRARNNSSATAASYQMNPGPRGKGLNGMMTTGIGVTNDLRLSENSATTRFVGGNNLTVTTINPDSGNGSPPAERRGCKIKYFNPILRWWAEKLLPQLQ